MESVCRGWTCVPVGICTVVPTSMCGEERTRYEPTEISKTTSYTHKFRALLLAMLMNSIQIQYNTKIVSCLILVKRWYAILRCPKTSDPYYTKSTCRRIKLGKQRIIRKWTYQLINTIYIMPNMYWKKNNTNELQTQHCYTNNQLERAS